MIEEQKHAQTDIVYFPWAEGLTFVFLLLLSLMTTWNFAGWIMVLAMFCSFLIGFGRSRIIRVTSNSIVLISINPLYGYYNISLNKIVNFSSYEAYVDRSGYIGYGLIYMKKSIRKVYSLIVFPL